MSITFMQAASAAPGFTAFVIGVCSLPVLVLAYFAFRACGRDQAFGAALRRPKNEVWFWVERSTEDVTDEIGIYQYTQHVRELYMKEIGRPPVLIADKHLAPYLSELESRGFTLLDGPPSNTRR